MPYLNDDAPITNGFEAGASWNNQTVYVGRGWYGSQLIPGRVQVKNNTGVYVSYVTETYLTQDTEYLVVPDGCSCYFLPPAAAVTHEGVVQNPDPNFKWYIGRVTFPSGYIAISKVRYSDYLQWYSTSVAETANTATEILVCETNGPTNVRPVVTSTNGACAAWRTYLNDNAPTFNGLYVGKSRVNTDVYVGRAMLNAQLEPGRVELTPATVGVWADYGAEYRVTSFIDYLVLPMGCECQWLKPTPAILNHPGLVRSIDANYRWVVGLNNISATQVAIAKVRTTPKDFFSWWSDVNGAGANGYATKVLVCGTADYVVPSACGRKFLKSALEL
jgi:hypothetical protein